MRHRNSLLRLLHTPSWALFGGFLLALSFPPLGLYPLAWLALVPLLVRWSHAPSPMMVFREAYATFLLMAAGAGFWVLLHTSINAALYSGVGLLIAPLGHALAFTLAYGVRRRFGIALGITALFLNVLAVEYLLSHGPYALPWLLLGNTQAAALPFNQIADLGGVGLLSTFVLATNFLGFLFVRSMPRPGMIPGWRTLLALVLLMLLSSTAVYGDERLSTLDTEPAILQIGLVQPGVRPESWSVVADGSRVEKLAQMSERLTPDSPYLVVRPASLDSPARPELLIWPEGALPSFPDPAQQQRLYARLTRWTDLRGVDLLTGAVTRRDTNSPYHNAAILFRPRMAPQFYAKVHLTPFAERVPFSSASPYIDAMTMPTAHARLASGDAPQALDGRNYQVGTVIGSESLHGDHVRRTVLQGSDFIVTLAQTGWWGHSPSPTQHLGLTRLRAIETRRAVVFSTVSGTSGVVYPDGTLEERSGWMEEDLEVIPVPLSTATTFYTEHGDWVGRFSVFGAFWLLLMWGGALAFFKKAPVVVKRKRPAI